jgi:hypothetical protein
MRNVAVRAGEPLILVAEDEFDMTVHERKLTGRSSEKIPELIESIGADGG